VSGPASEREAERQRRAPLRLRRWIRNEGGEGEENGQAVEFLPIFLWLAGFGLRSASISFGRGGCRGCGLCSVGLVDKPRSRVSWLICWKEKYYLLTKKYGL